MATSRNHKRKPRRKDRGSSKSAYSDSPEERLDALPTLFDRGALLTHILGQRCVRLLYSTRRTDAPPSETDQKKATPVFSEHGNSRGSGYIYGKF